MGAFVWNRELADRVVCGPKLTALRWYPVNHERVESPCSRPLLSSSNHLDCVRSVAVTGFFNAVAAVLAPLVMLALTKRATQKAEPMRRAVSVYPPARGLALRVLGAGVICSCRGLLVVRSRF